MIELTTSCDSLGLRRLILAVFVLLGFSIGVSAQDLDFKIKDMTVQTAVMELQKKSGYSVAVKSFNNILKAFILFVYKLLCTADNIV